VRAKDSKNFLSCKCMMVLLAHFIFSRWWKTKKKFTKKGPNQRCDFWELGKQLPTPPSAPLLETETGWLFLLWCSSSSQKKNPHKVPPQNPQRLAHKGPGKLLKCKARNSSTTTITTTTTTTVDESKTFRWM